MPTSSHPCLELAAIGQRLLLVRQAMGLSQVDFAERAGISPTAYNGYERGKKRPSIENAVMLADAHGLTLDWIYRDDMSGLRYETAAAIKALRAERSIP